MNLSVDDRWGLSGIIGIGDPLEKLEFLQHPARSFGDRAERVVGNMYRKAGLFGYEAINASQQSSSARHNDSTVHQIGGQFWGASFEGNAHRFQNTGKRLLQGLAN